MSWLKNFLLPTSFAEGMAFSGTKCFTYERRKVQDGKS